MLFYSVVAYVLGFIILCSAFLNIKQKSLITSLLFIISGLIFITLATLSFILDPKYEWILVLALIVECVINLLVFYLSKNK